MHTRTLLMCMQAPFMRTRPWILVYMDTWSNCIHVWHPCIHRRGSACTCWHL